MPGGGRGRRRKEEKEVVNRARRKRKIKEAGEGTLSGPSWSFSGPLGASLGRKRGPGISALDGPLKRSPEGTRTGANCSAPWGLLKPLGGVLAASWDLLGPLGD
eukprot:6415929-Pyramimonas_sp.AAC.1